MANQLPVPELCKNIKALIEKGDHAAKKANQFYIAAGRHLAELKARKPDGTSWPDYVKAMCDLSRSRADEMIQIGNGTTTIEKVRAATVQRVRKHRASDPPLRNGGSETALVEADEFEEDEDPTAGKPAHTQNDEARFLSGRIHELLEPFAARCGSLVAVADACTEDRRTMLLGALREGRDTFARLIAELEGPVTAPLKFHPGDGEQDPQRQIRKSFARVDRSAGKLMCIVGLDLFRQLATDITEEEAEWHAFGSLLRDRLLTGDLSQGGDYKLVDARWDKLHPKRRRQAAA